MSSPDLRPTGSPPNIVNGLISLQPLHLMLLLSLAGILFFLGLGSTGLTDRDEGGHPQWAYRGKPVYTFVQDKTDVHPQADSVLPEVKLARP